MPAQYDVVVIGSGIAGGFLARQLKLARPAFSILVLEVAEKIEDFKVGESTVEVSSSYMIRRLGLSTYLYQHQLPKNGLRFFFDSPEKDMALPEMSEIGTDGLPYHPSFQLERASLERDLVGLNRTLGIEIELGAKVVDLTIDPSGPHTVVWERGGERHEVRTQWLCDASGRRQVLQRKLGHKVTKEARLNTGAAWGRYRNIAGLDAIDDPAWKGRVRHTPRHLSTNHFMYDGYWIWFIPLAQDIMSVGVVYDKDRCPDGPRRREDMEAFLDKHRAPRELMKGAIFEDFRSYVHLPFYSDTYFSTDRWALTGEAGAFTDPFYSPGSDFIAVANDLITAIITTDDEERGKSSAAPGAKVTELVDLANRFYRFKYETQLAVYTSQYPIFGSYELMRLKFLLDFHTYYNLVYWPFLAGKHTDPVWLKEHVGYGELAVKSVRAFGDLLARLGHELQARGEYHERNRGAYVDQRRTVRHLDSKIGPTLDPVFSEYQNDRAFGEVFAEIVERMLRVPGLALRERVLRELTLPVSLGMGDIEEKTLADILHRVSASLTRELRDQFPDDGIELVTLEADAPSGAPRDIRIGVLGPREDRRAALVEHARRLWDERAESILDPSVSRAVA